MHAFEDAASGALTLCGATADGTVLTWLDATVPSEPLATHAATGATARFAATPLTGADAPGYLGLLGTAAGRLVVLLAGRGHVAVKQVYEQVLAARCLHRSCLR